MFAVVYVVGAAFLEIEKGQREGGGEAHVALPRLTWWFSATVYVTILHFLVHVSIYLPLHFIDVNEWTSFFFRDGAEFRQGCRHGALWPKFGLYSLPGELV